MRGRKSGERGSALILAVVVSVVGVGLAGTALTIAAFQSRSTGREVTRERALRTAESGLDDTIYRMNNWTFGIGTISTVAGTIGGDAYTVTITPPFTGINGQYRLRATSARDHERRGVEVVVTPTVASPFPGGLTAKDKLTMVGTMHSDSFNSMLGTYMSQRVNFDPVHSMWYARPNGHVASNADISGTGTVNVYGSATPGPTGTYSSSGGAYVQGSTTAAPAPMTFSAVPPYAPPIPSAGTPGPGSLTLSAGVYRYDKIAITGSANITFSGDVTLYVDGDFTCSGSAFLKANAGSNVKIIHNSGKISLSGGGLINDTLNASKFAITSGTSSTVTLSGGTTFYGTVYAPNSAFTASGGTHFYGAFVGNTINASGGAFFHYDEALSYASTWGAFRVRSWIEFVP